MLARSVVVAVAVMGILQRGSKTGTTFEPTDDRFVRRDLEGCVSQAAGSPGQQMCRCRPEGDDKSVQNAQRAEGQALCPALCPLPSALCPLEGDPETELRLTRHVCSRREAKARRRRRGRG